MTRRKKTERKAVTGPDAWKDLFKLTKPRFRQEVGRHPFRRDEIPDSFDLPIEDSGDKAVAFVYREDVWVEVPLGNKWVVAYRLIEQHGYPVVAELRVFPAEESLWRDSGFPRRSGRWSAEVLGHKAAAPRGGITARMLRAVRIGEHHRIASEFIDWLRKQGERLPPAQEFKGGSLAGITSEFEIDDSKQLAPDRPPRRLLSKGRPEIEYAEIARDYVEQLRAGSKRPIADLAKWYPLPKSKVRDMVYAARQRGLLSRPRQEEQQGKRGGVLTEKARRLLGKTKSQKKGDR